MPDTEPVPDAGGAKTPPVPTITQGMPVFAGAGGKIALGFAILAILLLAFIGNQLWDFVITANEEREKEDYDQLSAIVQPLVAAAGLVLGAIFGSVTQSAATKSNATAAEKNADAVGEQKDAAKGNLEAAKKLGALLKEARDALAGDSGGVVIASADHSELIDKINNGLNPAQTVV